MTASGSYVGASDSLGFPKRRRPLGVCHSLEERDVKEDSRSILSDAIHSEYFYSIPSTGYSSSPSPRSVAPVEEPEEPSWKITYPSHASHYSSSSAVSSVMLSTHEMHYSPPLPQYYVHGEGVKTLLPLGAGTNGTPRKVVSEGEGRGLDLSRRPPPAHRRPQSLPLSRNGMVEPTAAASAPLAAIPDPRLTSAVVPTWRGDRGEPLDTNNGLGDVGSPRSAPEWHTSDPRKEKGSMTVSSSTSREDTNTEEEEEEEKKKEMDTVHQKLVAIVREAPPNREADQDSGSSSTETPTPLLPGSPFGGKKAKSKPAPPRSSGTTATKREGQRRPTPLETSVSTPVEGPGAEKAPVQPQGWTATIFSYLQSIGKDSAAGTGVHRRPPPASKYARVFPSPNGREAPLSTSTNHYPATNREKKRDARVEPRVSPPSLSSTDPRLLSQMASTRSGSASNENEEERNESSTTGSSVSFIAVEEEEFTS